MYWIWRRVLIVPDARTSLSHDLIPAGEVGGTCTGGGALLTHLLRAPPPSLARPFFATTLAQQQHHGRRSSPCVQKLRMWPA